MAVSVLLRPAREDDVPCVLAMVKVKMHTHALLERRVDVLHPQAMFSLTCTLAANYN